MTRTLLGLTLIAALAVSACGVDGEPERPTRAEMPATGIAVTGSVSVGVGGTF